MLVGIDHVIVAVADLDIAAAGLGAALGLEVGGGGRHPAQGTRNRLAWWGDAYLELVAVEDEVVAAAHWFGAAVLAALSGARAGADASEDRPASVPTGAPVGLALASDDLAADAAAMGLAGITEGERARPDGRVVRWRMARPGLAGAASARWPTIFLIEHDRSGAEWTDAERADRARALHPAGTPISLRTVSVAVASVPAAAGQVGRAFALLFRPSLAGGGARDASIGAHTLRLVAARDGVPRLAIELRGGHEARHTDLLGCRWIMAPA